MRRRSLFASLANHSCCEGYAAHRQSRADIAAVRRACGSGANAAAAHWSHRCGPGRLACDTTGSRGINSTGRGTEAMAWSYALLDRTVYGRQEVWEDSPEGWPHEVGTRGEQFRIAGRPTIQWSVSQPDRESSGAQRNA
jgi:hypothetical protein